MSTKQLEYRRRGRPIRIEYRGCTSAKYANRGADAIRKKQFGGGKHSVVFAESKSASSGKSRNEIDCRMDMHDALRHPGGARRVKPVGNFIGAGLGGRSRLALRGQQSVETLQAVRLLIDHDDMLERCYPLGRGQHAWHDYPLANNDSGRMSAAC